MILAVPVLDPRFNSLCGKLNEDLFQKSYQFLEGYKVGHSCTSASCYYFPWILQRCSPTRKLIGIGNDGNEKSIEKDEQETFVGSVG